ncbi:ABC-F family ATP-binding cassette domain-containing protein [[Limnothrix rosea] IAM M-220]|uniref:ABC-F family ATP-binding cassette domain-containing protein n=1 Tax=[Limnothrix rosea] IAM M-220 TaxID=454133 RepID=UPI0009649F70|nr:ABC-F family ATP-binding cassette domain-containing protein [[Limnothrix rosea] IAM M-220]OKH17062.1 multidrug ABC transporter ATP-binding protein [[Limnothrix rosea] IAM M-220]
MSIITLQSVSKDFGIKEILREGNFSVDDTEKVGLIGVNGGGKSTLLKMIAGIEPIDSGKRLVRSGARIVYLPQQPEIDPENTVLDQVFADCSEQMKWVRDYEDLSHRMAIAEGDELNSLMGKLSEITAKMDALNAWEMETNAKIILSKLGITDLEVKVGSLSGGYRKRIALAAALLSEPDLLLMDEPTNHLDADSVEWLQSYLNNYSGAILLITHDRYFLDQVTNRILEIDRGDLYAYSGNYSYYLEKKALAEEAAISSQQKHKGVLRRELEWLKRGPQARATKQKARIDRIHDMKDKVFKEAQGKVEIDTPGRRIGKKVIEVENLAKSYGDRLIIKNFTYEFNPGDRIGIIGGNGAGKSTFLNLITQRIEPDSGTVDIGSTIHIGYFDQHSDDLDEKTQQQRVIEYIKDVATYVETADGTQISASQMLERFLFPPDQQYAPIHKLSGGEKRRLFLLKILMAAPNLLILDEPTNDLDVQTLSILEDYLEDFNGCVVIVAHDRYFLDRTVHTIFSLEGQGTLRQYPGNYSVYLDYKKIEEAKKAEQEAAQVKATPTKAPTKTKAKTYQKPKSVPNRLSNYQRKELERLEMRVIPELEKKKAALEAQLCQQADGDYEKLQSLSDALTQLNQEIETKTERWLELAELDH